MFCGTQPTLKSRRSRTLLPGAQGQGQGRRERPHLFGSTGSLHYYSGQQRGEMFRLGPQYHHGWQIILTYVSEQAKYVSKASSFEQRVVEHKSPYVSCFGHTC